MNGVKLTGKAKAVSLLELHSLFRGPLSEGPCRCLQFVVSAGRTVPDDGRMHDEGGEEIVQGNLHHCEMTALIRFPTLPDLALQSMSTLIHSPSQLL